MSKVFPTIKEVKETVDQAVSQIKSIENVKKVMAFGSYAQNINNPDFRVKDVDIIVVLPFHSEDLIAINKKVLAAKTDILGDMGFDIEAVKVSKKLNKIDLGLLDKWAISQDNKLLHWGPFITNKEESEEIKKEAESHAEKETGFNLSKLNKLSSSHREEWFGSFQDYIKNQFAGMPSGWYCSEESDICSVLSQAHTFS